MAEEEAEEHASVTRCCVRSPLGTSCRRQYQNENHGVVGLSLSSDVMAEEAREAAEEEEDGHASVISC